MGNESGGTRATGAAGRQRALTRGQAFLAGTAVVLELALTPVFFIVMFVTVNEMLGPYFDGWAWAAPVATEITFVLLLLLAVLFEWMRRPVPVLWKLPYLFAGLSVFMNVWAYRTSAPGMAGHLAVTAAFFIPLGFAKTTVRKLIVTPAERARAQALADASAYATDVLRSALGLLWRQRTPLLTRRQLRAGRLPAAVMAAVETGDAARWERSVEDWITAAVVLPERFAGVLAAARAEASQGAPGRTARSVAQATSGAGTSGTAEADGGTYAGHSASAPRIAAGSTPAEPKDAPAANSRGNAGRHARLIPSKATNEQLADLVVPLLADGAVSKYAVIEAVREAAGGKGKPSIGDKRAGDVLTLARERAGATVTPIDARRQA
ncbi:MAG: hypothetical protein ACRDN1_25280 [Trebonia sp.]